MTEEGESREEQLARNVSELISELRLAQAGVKILLGFLFAVVFQAAFREASGFEKGLHLVTVLVTAASSALLTAPAVWHRLLFRQGRRPDILRVGNRLVVSGLVCLAVAITLTVALIVKVVYGSIVMVVLGSVMGMMFTGLWFVMPFRIGRRR